MSKPQEKDTKDNSIKWWQFCSLGKAGYHISHISWIVLIAVLVVMTMRPPWGHDNNNSVTYIIGNVIGIFIFLSSLGIIISYCVWKYCCHSKRVTTATFCIFIILISIACYIGHLRINNLKEKQETGFYKYGAQTTYHQNGQNTQETGSNLIKRQMKSGESTKKIKDLSDKNGIITADGKNITEEEYAKIALTFFNGNNMQSLWASIQLHTGRPLSKKDLSSIVECTYPLSCKPADNISALKSIMPQLKAALSLKLKQTIIGKTPVAVINSRFNDQIITQGDVITGFTITEIKQKYVMLERNNFHFKLRIE